MEMGRPRDETERATLQPHKTAARMQEAQVGQPHNGIECEKVVLFDLECLSQVLQPGSQYPAPSKHTRPAHASQEQGKRMQTHHSEGACVAQLPMCQTQAMPSLQGVSPTAGLGGELIGPLQQCLERIALALRHVFLNTPAEGVLEWNSEHDDEAPIVSIKVDALCHLSPVHAQAQHGTAGGSSRGSRNEPRGSAA